MRLVFYYEVVLCGLVFHPFYIAKDNLLQSQEIKSVCWKKLMMETYSFLSITYGPLSNVILKHSFIF
jgi:hypothetical protein